MSTPLPPPTPPGWYPNPSGAPGQQYWDGASWSTAVAFAPPSSQPARITIHYGFMLLAIFSILGTLLIGIPLLSSASDSDPDVASVGTGMGVLWMLWGGMWTLIWTAFAVNHTLKSRRG